MREKKVRLVVSMPGKVVMDDEVDMVILTTAAGDKGILPGHEPSSVVLRSGALRVVRGGASEVALTVLGGYATIQDGAVNVVTPIADTPENIEQAVNAIIAEREHNIKYEQTANLEISRAEMALRNILLRRDDSTFAIPKIHTRNDI
ncbi:MAG: F0F1 ATP synthase subunit epsilon [Oscillospiraceae bacterium]|nr:F0F1 ATP synthase subunit epsilon [Oscillospiraceae bacterium]